MTFLVDSHCHLGDLKFGDIDQDLNEVLDNARDAGVTHMLCVNTDLGTFPVHASYCMHLTTIKTKRKKTF